MLDFGAVNWLAVVAGVVFSMILGFLWYGPLFGKRWMAMSGKTEEDTQAEPSMWILTIIASALAMTALALIVAAFGADSFADGVIAGVVPWVLAAAALFTHSLFEGTHTGVWALFVVYQLIVWGVMGGVFAVWT